ncbi:hypothetical protein N781_05860 [Pontibacillus halophilus JSM 076056 = DSM 19796]|uniref:PNPLA domain-containing protein n=1 Tax=Pontibacillus halophilus JSM 076056 = DSM 19796 TaxID=1385510 RepID=A0A0A5I4Y5_9BACI|nr:patatin-like phospholipase family protein [Pontibacillus halophilus]KGX90892.1 hypothetical protein N781_05860 [Pontibacillus halophilus JSM 076056 = DSM 19796]
MNIDGVFSGGGVKGIAFIGAIEEIESRGYTFKRVAGTSAGAIIAAFLAAGYRSKDISELFYELNLKKLLDPPALGYWIPFTKWLYWYYEMGLFKGKKLEKWIYDVLAKKGVYTFQDLPEGTLKMIAADLTLGKLVVIPDDLEELYGISPKEFTIARAVRMSAGLPYFFIPARIVNKHTTVKSIMVDGGLLSNFPIWLFTSPDEKRTRPIVGMKLSASPQKIKPRAIKNAKHMVHALFATMKQAHDARYITKAEAADILFIPVQKVDTTDFDLNEETKDELIQLGRDRAIKFLKTWRG